MSETPEKKSLTEQDFSLISQAQDEFNRKQYNNCLQTLSQLELSMGSNYKISHNKAVTEFYKTDCNDYKTFLNFLNHQIFEIQRNPSSSKIRYAAASYYNKAVILYHLRKPFAALDTLTAIVEKLDDLDESLTPRVGLLMLTLLLTTSQVKRALSFLKTFQNHLGINLDTLPGDETSSPESLNNIDGFKRLFKLISMLIYIVNKKTVIVPDDGSVEFALLKAHQFYVGKDFQMAAKQLSKKFVPSPFSFEQNTEDQDTCIANNMGIIHLRVRHYAIAVKFFQHAITFDNQITANISNFPLHSVGASKKPEILYNLGIAMLHLQRPREAFECLLIPLKVYHNNPRLWLRTAESCIMLHNKSANEHEKKHIVSSIVGSGMHRKYILEPNPKIKVPDDGQSFAIPNPNLEFAALCLRNAVSLVDYYKKKFYQTIKNADVGNESWTQVNDENFCNPSMPVTKESFDVLIAAVYAAYSYVCIRLGEFTVGLEYAKSLLMLENLSDANAMLGHLYCAEALIMLNRVTEARAHLEPNFITSLNAFDFETRNWQINSIEAAQSVMRYNLVVTLVLQGEFEVAKALLSTCVHPVVAIKVKMLKMYIEIAVGNIDSSKIKNQRF